MMCLDKRRNRKTRCRMKRNGKRQRPEMRESEWDSVDARRHGMFTRRRMVPRSCTTLGGDICWREIAALVEPSPESSMGYIKNQWLRWPVTTATQHIEGDRGLCRTQVIRRTTELSTDWLPCLGPQKIGHFHSFYFPTLSCRRTTDQVRALPRMRKISQFITKSSFA